MRKTKTERQGIERTFCISFYNNILEKLKSERVKKCDKIFKSYSTITL